MRKRPRKDVNDRRSSSRPYDVVLELTSTHLQGSFTLARRWCRGIPCACDVSPGSSEALSHSARCDCCPSMRSKLSVSCSCTSKIRVGKCTLHLPFPHSPHWRYSLPRVSPFPTLSPYTRKGPSRLPGLRLAHSSHVRKGGCRFSLPVRVWRRGTPSAPRQSILMGGKGDCLRAPPSFACSSCT